MTKLTLQQLEGHLHSFENDNEGIDLHISNLKVAMKESGPKEAVFKPDRLSQYNRQGGKTMQAYFKKYIVKGQF